MLRKLRPPGAYVEINSLDAERLGIEPGAPVSIASRRGSALATAFVTLTIPRGQVFIPMHYKIANELSLAVFDPYSGQPAYKACAVSLSAASPKTV